MAKHVVFVGPDLFSAYVDMVRGLKQAGGLVTGIGHTPKARLDPRLAHHLDHYVQVGNLMDPGTVFESVRGVDRLRSVDLLETGDESLVLPVAKAAVVVVTTPLCVMLPPAVTSGTLVFCHAREVVRAHIAAAVRRPRRSVRGGHQSGPAGFCQ